MASLLQHSDWLNGRVPDEVRAQLRQLVEVVGYLPYPQPLGVITADAVLLAANRPFLELLRAAGDDLLGADWDDFMPGWSERVGRDAPAVSPRTHAFEDYVLAGDGEPVWVSVVASPILTPGVSGEPDEALAGWTLFVIDQTPREGDSDERRRREILELLLESPTEFVVHLDAAGHVRFLSPALRRALGMGGMIEEGRHLADAHGQAMGRGFADDFRGLLDVLARPPFRAQREMIMATPSGERVVEWDFESLLADGGELTGVLGVGRDVTERRAAEREREQSELRLRTLVEATSQLIWVTGPGGAIESEPGSWTTFTGQSGDDMAGDGWSAAVHPDDRQAVLDEWTAAVMGRRAYECAYRLRSASGEYRWIESRAVPLPGEDGDVYYFGVGQDVTERKVAEEAVKRRLELETMASAISSRFASADRESAPAAIDYALVEVGLRLGAGRIGLYTLGADGLTVDALRVWRRDTGLLEDGDASFGLQDVAWLRARLAERRPAAIERLGELPPDAVAEREIFARLGLAAALVVPIAQDATLAGFLVLDVRAGDSVEAEGRHWGDDDLHLLRLLADQLAGLLVWRADECNLRSVSEAFLAFGPDVEANLTHLCRAAAEVTAADMVLYNRRRGDELVTETGWGLPDDLPRVTKAAGRACADLMARPDDDVRVIRDLQDTVFGHTSPIIRRYGLRTYAGFPVKRDGRAVATMSCLFVADVALRESQLELLCVLGRAAAVEEERRLALEERVLGLAQIEQAMERTVATLSGAMGTRDPYTAGHERRVAQLSLAIGGELGLEANDLRLLRLAATVHDIGKIAVPAEILSKPTRLSGAEFAIIKRHSEAGWELLEPAGLPASVTDAVLQHHERLDGTGYPAGLRGDDIGEFARIIAVADVVEAMARHRPYRSALGIEPALEEIEGGSGLRYDPRVAAACLRLFREQGFRFAE